LSILIILGTSENVDFFKRIRAPMRKRLIIFFVLLLLLPAGYSAGKVPRLVFEKDISMRKEQLLRYEVREQEHLYQIMRSFGLTNTQIAKIMPEIKKLNPHIKDLSNLQPGQTLTLPVLKSSEKAVSEQMERWKAKPVHTRVRPGESVVSMLRRIGKVPHYLIFNEYLNLFRDLNPDIDNINRLEPGQDVSLPVYTGDAKKSRAGSGKGNTTASASVASAGKKEARGKKEEAEKSSGNHTVALKNDSSEEVRESSNDTREKEQNDDSPVHPLRERCLSALKALGLEMVPGESMFFPRQDGSWLRIDLNYTPVIKDFADRKILLAEKMYVQKWKKELEDTSIDVCPAFNWDAKSVLEWIGSRSTRDIRIWKHDRPFFISIGEISLEFRADLIVKISGRGMYIVNFVSGSGSGELAQNFLRSLGLKYSEFRVRDSGRVEPAFSRMKPSSIYVPQEDRAKAGDFSRTMSSGKNTGRENIRMKVLEDGEHELIMSFDLKTAPDGRLLLSGKTANPYLFAMLNAAGRDCLMLH